MPETLEAYSLCSGSSGNSYLIKNRSCALLIDAGRSARVVLNAAALCSTSPEEIRAVFVTHDHSDHICGIPVLAKKTGCAVYATHSAAAALSAGVPPEKLAVCDPGYSVMLGELLVRSYPTPHDSPESVCYRVTDTVSGESVAVCTDIGYVSDEVFECLYGCNAVALESNHDTAMLRCGPYPYFLKQRIISKYGPLSNESCAKLLPRLALSGTSRFLLSHLSRENNTPELALRSARCALAEFPNAFIAAASPDTPVRFR